MDTFWKLLGWLGLPAETFVRSLDTGGTAQVKPSRAALGVVRESLRDDPKLTPATAAALDEIFTVAYLSFTGVMSAEAENRTASVDDESPQD